MPGDVFPGAKLDPQVLRALSGDSGQVLLGKIVKSGDAKSEKNPAKYSDESVSKLPEKPGRTEDENTISETVGEPLAPGMIQLLRDEIVNDFRDRGTTANFNKFQNYAAHKLNASNAAYTGNELTGNCRLELVRPLVLPAIRSGAISEAEEFTRTLHTTVVHDRGGLAGLLPVVAEKMDLTAHKVANVHGSTFAARGARDCQAGAGRCPRCPCRHAGAAKQRGNSYYSQLL